MATAIHRNTDQSVLANGLDNPANIHVLRVLERGLVLNRFFSKRRPEKRMFQVKLETRQLIWIRVAGSRPEGFGELLDKCSVIVGCLMLSLTCQGQRSASLKTWLPSGVIS